MDEIREAAFHPLIYCTYCNAMVSQSRIENHLCKVHKISKNKLDAVGLQKILADGKFAEKCEELLKEEKKIFHQFFDFFYEKINNYIDKHVMDDYSSELIGCFTIICLIKCEIYTINSLNKIIPGWDEKEYIEKYTKFSTLLNFIISNLNNEMEEWDLNDIFTKR